MIVVDGLGYGNLAARAGYGRYLWSAASEQGDEARIVSGFPSTTVSQLTSLTTGVSPGEHGLVGYSLRNPETGTVANLIGGWDDEAMVPELWQPVPTLFEAGTADGVRSAVFGPPAYAGSGFSRAFLRGADYRGVTSIRERLAAAVSCAVRGDADVVYAYVPTVDAAGHRDGWQSERWSAALEEVDAAVKAAVADRGRVSVLVTADHGMVDVPQRGHLALDLWQDFAGTVCAVAGEPRCPQLSLWDPADADEVARGLGEWLPEGIVAASKDTVIRSGLLGEVTAAAAQRLGDVLVFCIEDGLAAYDMGSASRGSLAMVGQHGSLAEAELTVPLLRYCD